MALAGWEVSPLVELFLIALLFGCGTDFCLFISWRLGEHWDTGDPANAMRAALKRSRPTLLTSAGTVIIGLSLMGTTRFKLFSTTGPSVAIGLVITLAASLTLTPALLVILARLRPSAFAGLTAPSSGLWEGSVPACSWAAASGELAGHARGHDSICGPRSALEFCPRRDDRNAPEHAFGEKPPVARHYTWKTGAAVTTDSRACDGRRSARVGGSGPHR